MSQSPKLFGTDGVRSVAGQYPLDRETVWKLGYALGEVLHRSSAPRPLRVLTARDTRESGPWIAALAGAGLAATGVEVSDAGVLTTPGVAYLTRHHQFAAGMMISASHNPYQDNGIKILSTSGTKLPETVELDIEAALDNVRAPLPASVPGLATRPDLHRDYLDFLAGLPEDAAAIRGFRVVMDCANGAASAIAPELAARLGLIAEVLNASPDGTNINAGCGSLYPAGMAEATRRVGADLGVAFDGDADRAIFATAAGRIVDGDHVLYAAAQFLQDRGRLEGGGVVGTLMTNFALERALAERGLELKRTPVGDRYVLEEMLRSGVNLGGEASGHIIFANRSLAGDGLITLIQMLDIMAGLHEGLDDLFEGYSPLPQLIANVRVRSKPALDSLPAVAAAMAECRREIDGNGRLVVRYSGTEGLARVMVEAEDAGIVQKHAGNIAAAIRDTIGAETV